MIKGMESWLGSKLPLVLWAQLADSLLAQDTDKNRYKGSKDILEENVIISMHMYFSLVTQDCW